MLSAAHAKLGVIPTTRLKLIGDRAMDELRVGQSVRSRTAVRRLCDAMALMCLNLLTILQFWQTGNNHRAGRYDCSLMCARLDILPRQARA